jgi:hypothetical protein
MDDEKPRTSATLGFEVLLKLIRAERLTCGPAPSHSPASGTFVLPSGELLFANSSQLQQESQVELSGSPGALDELELINGDTGVFMKHLIS